MSPPAEPRPIKKPTGVTISVTPVFSLSVAKRRFAPDQKARSDQSAGPFVMTGFPSASSSGVNPPAYPLAMKR